ncbi:chromate efflux transporter [Stenotrophomonas maltophilia]|uniref:chromate efflux transporter n=1 Tax=Stenotrophomonas TaxID=40323 RepID=UPI000657FAC5|nr:chromate efflux transporter [Stenotrophomonas maltophilia]PZS52504.1 chromate transporter [Stenotrophomonas maltophilia]CRQ74354.1 Chromate transport protein [Pseudomonas aeruginosa]
MSTLDPTTSDSAWRVFLVFLRLGLTSFGGPIAHLSYFRLEFVERRRWLTDRSYSDLVALCQLLPGPASSQVGMALGLRRAGWAGLLAAWAGFTLPSAVLMILFALGVAGYEGIAESGWLHGLKIVAVAVVAQAVWGMARSLCPDRLRAGMAFFAAVLTLSMPSVGGQVVVIIVSGLLGRWMLKIEPASGQSAGGYPVSRRTGKVALMLLVLPLVLLPVWVVASGSPLAVLLEGTYRAGALVFGGGHVVLPLLQTAVVQSGTVTTADLLAGYGAAQAVPGPLFTFAAYLGAVAEGPVHGWAGGLMLLLVIFLPALLVLVGVLPFWESLRHRKDLQASIAGVNAGVVGILLAALYDPVWTSAIHDRWDVGMALLAFGLLVVARSPPIVVVLLTAIAGWLMAG